MRFTKMQGLGNDFLVVDDREAAPYDWAAVARRLCDRRRGVGADGVLLIQEGPALRMRLFNADGSEAEMCGNGVRCVAVYARDRGLGGARVTWATGAGPVVTELGDDGLVTVDMGPPRFAPGDVPFEHEGDEALDVPVDAGGRTLRVSAVGMGNPHCVVVVEDVDAYPVLEVGPLLEGHRRFPRRTNVEFVQVVSRSRVRQRTFERGVGETDACGTGACAAAVALRRLGLVDGPTDVVLRGGVLRIAWKPGGPVMMTGPAETVYEGEVMLLDDERIPTGVGR